MKKLTTYEDKNGNKYVPPPDDYESPMLGDVFGSQKLKDSLEEIMINIEKGDLFQMFGSKPYKSFIFSGPPGNGKTYTYKALRNEVINCGNNVAPLAYDIGTYGTAYINEGAKILQNFFNSGHKLANDGYIVMYWFDEADVLMSKRGGSHSHKEDDKLLDCLMKNLQQINTYCEREYVFFATNFIQAMDDAAIRSGRVDKIITFEKPDQETRKQYLQYQIKQKNKTINELYQDGLGLFKKLNYNRLSELTDNFNFSDLNSLIDRSVRHNIREMLHDDKIDICLQIYETDIIKVIDKMKEERDFKSNKRIGFV